MKYNPSSTCLLRLDLIRCNQCSLGIGQNQCAIWIISSLSHSIDTRMKAGGGGEKPCNPYVISVTSQGCFGVGLRCDLGIIQAMIDITSEHNVSKNNQNQLFSAVLSWFHLAVTLRWSQHDLGVAPLWNQTPTDVIMCNWVGFRLIYWKCLSNNVVSTILWWFELAMTLRWPYHDLGITPYPVSTKHMYDILHCWTNVL